MKTLRILLFAMGAVFSLGCQQQQQQPQPQPMYLQQTAQTCVGSSAPNCVGMGSPIGYPSVASPYLPSGMVLPAPAGSGIGTPGLTASTIRVSSATQKLEQAIRTKYNLDPSTGSVSPARSDDAEIGVARLADASNGAGSAGVGGSNDAAADLRDRLAARAPSSAGSANGGNNAAGTSNFNSFVRHEDFSNSAVSPVSQSDGSNEGAGSAH